MARLGRESNSGLKPFCMLGPGNLVEDWWEENFRISRHTFDHIVPVVRPDLANDYCLCLLQ